MSANDVFKRATFSENTLHHLKKIELILKAKEVKKISAKLYCELWTCSQVVRKLIQQEGEQRG